MAEEIFRQKVFARGLGEQFEIETSILPEGKIIVYAEQINPVGDACCGVPQTLGSVVDRGSGSVVLIVGLCRDWECQKHRQCC